MCLFYSSAAGSTHWEGGHLNDPDWWWNVASEGLLGAILGGVVTALAVILTLRHDRRLAEKANTDATSLANQAASEQRRLASEAAAQQRQAAGEAAAEQRRLAAEAAAEQRSLNQAAAEAQRDLAVETLAREAAVSAQTSIRDLAYAFRNDDSLAEEMPRRQVAESAVGGFVALTASHWPTKSAQVKAAMKNFRDFATATPTRTFNDRQQLVQALVVVQNEILGWITDPRQSRT
jgi:hypothetical protein